LTSGHIKENGLDYVFRVYLEVQVIPVRQSWPLRAPWLRERC